MLIKNRDGFLVVPVFVHFEVYINPDDYYWPNDLLLLSFHLYFFEKDCSVLSGKIWLSE